MHGMLHMDKETHKVDNIKYPILAKWLEKGQIFVDKGVYCGWVTEENTNGQTDTFSVQLGNVGYEKDCEKYLTTHPSPSKW